MYAAMGLPLVQVSIATLPVFLAYAAPLTCEGGLEGLLPEEFFEKFDMFQSLYIRDSLKRSREFLYTIYLPKIAPNVDECMNKCPAAVLEIMMNAVLAVDADYSFGEAIELYELVIRLANTAADAVPAVSDMLEGWKHDTAHTYPFLFDMLPHSCYNSSLRIFVYDVPANLTAPVLECVHGQWGTEVLFHKFFLNGACRTRDPWEADFFFVPVYGTCLSRAGNLASDEHGGYVLWDPLLRFLASFGPFWARRGQRDHIFLFADGQSARIWDSSELVRGESIMMMVESKCPTWDVPTRRYTDIISCASGWKDIIISGHTDHARAQRMRLYNRPTDERDILMTFHGRHPGNDEVYSNCVVREKVMQLAEFDGVDVGGHVEDYLELKGRSHFCLIPGGTSPWTNHLYESLFCGCIPVILSDEYEVAFQHVLQWSKFSIKWPEAAVDERLYHYLRSFQSRELETMKEQVDQHACWVDYWSDDPGCSPYLAVVRALEERKRNFPPHQGRFWNVGNALADMDAQMLRRTTRFHSTADEAFML